MAQVNGSLNGWMLLQAQSPEESREILKSLKSKDRKKVCYVALMLTDPRLLLCPFEYRDINPTQLRSAIQSDITHILGVPLEEVEFDYQIFQSGPEGIVGCFLCLPKAILSDYLSVLDKEKLIPLKMTSRALCNIEIFAGEHYQKDGKYCVLDFFSHNQMSFAVFDSSRCVSLRQIPYSTVTEIKNEIIQSMRSVLARNQFKAVDEIYVLGSFEQRAELIAHLHSHFGIAPQVVEVKNSVPASYYSGHVRLDLDLLKQYTVALPLRKRILAAARAVLLLLLILSLVSWVQIAVSQQKISQLRSFSLLTSDERTLTTKLHD